MKGSIRRLLSRLAHDRRAVTTLEYALIAGMVSVVSFLVMSRFGVNLAAAFGLIGSDVSAA